MGGFVALFKTSRGGFLESFRDDDDFFQVFGVEVGDLGASYPKKNEKVARRGWKVLH